MKALKEKRISLRTLWRRSLVILSLLALVFASCGGSDNSDPVTPSDPGATPSSKYPVNISVVTTTPNRDVFEGMPVDLEGITFAVRYSDNSTAFIPADLSKMAVSPRLYTWNKTGALDGSLDTPTGHYAQRPNYRVTLSEGGKSVFVDILYADMGNHYRLVDVHYTGAFSKQEYYVDELPSFAGVSVEGVYDSLDATAGGGAKPNTPGLDDQARYIHKAIPISLNSDWKWVFNASTAYVDDDPAVLFAFGAWGNTMEVDTKSPDGSSTTAKLTGLRIPVKTLYQVMSLEWETPPALTSKTLFFDDPTMIGANANTLLWLDYLNDGVMKVNFSGGVASRSVKLSDLYIDGYTGLAGGSDKGDKFEGGKVDLNLLMTQAIADLDGGTDQSLRGRRIGYNSAGATAGRDGYRASGLQWTEWVKKNPTVSIEYRGKFLDTPVPVYNKLSAIEVVSKTGNLVIMDGLSKVYHRPMVRSDFLDAVKISAIYTLATDATQTARREDVVVDQKAGTVRTNLALDYTVTANITNNAPLTNTDVRSWIEAIPVTTDEVIGNPVGTLLPAPRDPGLLTKPSSDAYLRTAKEVKVNVLFPAFYPDANPALTGLMSGTIQKTARASINIGTVNYTLTP